MKPNCPNVQQICSLFYEDVSILDFYG